MRDIRHAVAPKQTLPPPLSPYLVPPSAAASDYNTGADYNAAGGGGITAAGVMNSADGGGDMSHHMNSLSLGKVNYFIYIFH
mgnify:CR=1 FL=1